MTLQTYRNLTEYEKAVIYKLLNSNFHGSDALKEQITQASARLMKTDDNYGSIVIRTSARNPVNLPLRVPVIGLTRDEAGGPVEILLHVVQGFVHELEFVRLDGKPMAGLPRLDIMQVHIESDPPQNNPRSIPN